MLSYAITGMDKIKLVVINENTLGYILPERPTWAGVLRASVIKGSVDRDCDITPITGKAVRLASERDFDEYRICFDGYNNDRYEFDQRGSLIVVSDTMLAVQYPENPGSAEVIGIDVFHSNSTVRSGDMIPVKGKNLRLATESDFSKFKVAFTPIGFGNPNRYRFQTA